MDHITPEHRSWNMSQIRGTDTKIEVKVRSWLFQKGFRFRKNDNRYPGKPDVVLPGYRTVIFVNGCFWHHHAGCKYATVPKTRTEYWVGKFKRNKQKDKEHYSQLKDMGWHVVVVWECELKPDRFNSTMEKVLEEIVSNKQL